MTQFDPTVFDMDESFEQDVRRKMAVYSEADLRREILATPKQIANSIGEFFGAEILSTDTRDYSDVFGQIETSSRRGWCLCDALRRKVAARLNGGAT